MTRKGGLSASEFARIEQAVADLWTLGVAHADLHSSNVMYHSPTKTVTILDFGFAVPLSASLVKRIRNHEDDVAIDKSVLYKNVLSRYVTNVIQRRIPGLNNFNEDGGMLRRLKMKMKGNALRARTRLLTQNNNTVKSRCNSFPTIDAVTRELINSIFMTINNTNGRRLGPRNSRTRYVDVS
jgi:tRNA A-37 threonylcarbamoyl transferase component Bud32